jgi:hypothetical protein
MVCEIEEDMTPIFQPSWKLGQLQDKGKNASVITTASSPALGPNQPSIQWVPGALSVGVKRPGREADHSRPPSNAEVKNAWRYTPFPQTPSWHAAQLKEVKSNRGTGTSVINNLSETLPTALLSSRNSFQPAVSYYRCI